MLEWLEDMRHRRIANGIAAASAADGSIPYLAAMFSRDEWSAIGPLGGFAISVDALARLLYAAQWSETVRYLEFGSGASTIAMASLLHRRGRNERLMTVDHDKAYLSVVAKKLSALELGSSVEFCHVALTETGRYSVSDRISHLQPNLVLIDGPPNWQQRRRRHGVLQFGKNIARPGTSVLVDDTNRRDERQLSRRIRAMGPHATSVQMYRRFHWITVPGADDIAGKAAWLG